MRSVESGVVSVLAGSAFRSDIVPVGLTIGRNILRIDEVTPRTAVWYTPDARLHVRYRKSVLDTTPGSF